MAVYTVNAKAACASAALKVAIQLATGAGITCKLVGVDISFDGVDATKTPILCELVVETGASSTGGSAFTPLQAGGGNTRTAQFTARVNDTTDGSAPSVRASWYIPPTTGMPYQLPLGREFEMPVSTFLAIRLTTVAGSGTPNYAVNAWVEE